MQLFDDQITNRFHKSLGRISHTLSKNYKVRNYCYIAEDLKGLFFKDAHEGKLAQLV